MRYFATLLLMLLLGGCGQTGPLYHPGEEPEPSSRRTSADNSEQPEPDGL